MSTITQGAATLRGLKNNPDDLLREIMETAPNPHDRDSILDEFKGMAFPHFVRDQMDPDASDMLLNIVSAWSMNAYNRAIVRFPQPGMTPAKKRAEAQKNAEKNAEMRQNAKKAAVDKVKIKIVQKAKALVLEMAAPNGKAIGDCTGSEMRSFGTWFAKIGALVKPNQIVRKVVSEDAAYAIAPKSLI